MRFSDLILTALRNLYQRKARTMLTIIGVIIGCMSITLMVAVGIGSQETFMENISQNTELTRIEVYAGYSSNPDQAKLDDKTVLQMESLTNVANVLPFKRISFMLESTRFIGEFYGMAIPFQKAEEVLGDKLEWGTFTKSSGRDINVIMGPDMLEYSFYKKRPNKDIWEMPQAAPSDINFDRETFDLAFGYYYYYQYPENLPEGVVLPKTEPAVVGGMLQRTGSEFDYSCMIDVTYLNEFLKENKKFAELVNVQDTYQNVYVYANDMENVEPILASIKEMGFEAYSPLEWINQMREESARQQIIWGAVGAIALLVSAIGIANTMLTSIMERRREIGILKVLGCALGKINLMFLIEAAVIGLLGGVIGVALSYGVTFLIQYLTSQGIGVEIFASLRFVIKPWLALATISGAAGVGMIAGIYPALRASRMSPLAALRDE